MEDWDFCREECGVRTLRCIALSSSTHFTDIHWSPLVTRDLRYHHTGVRKQTLRSCRLQAMEREIDILAKSWNTMWWVIYAEPWETEEDKRRISNSSFDIGPSEEQVSKFRIKGALEEAKSGEDRLRFRQRAEVGKNGAYPGNQRSGWS